LEIKFEEAENKNIAPSKKKRGQIIHKFLECQEKTAV
jgi:hypothetical protein